MVNFFAGPPATSNAVVSSAASNGGIPVFSQDVYTHQVDARPLAGFCLDDYDREFQRFFDAFSDVGDNMSDACGSDTYRSCMSEVDMEDLAGSIPDIPSLGAIMEADQKLDFTDVGGDSLDEWEQRLRRIRLSGVLPAGTATPAVDWVDEHDNVVGGVLSRLEELVSRPTPWRWDERRLCWVKWTGRKWLHYGALPLVHVSRGHYTDWSHGDCDLAVPSGFCEVVPRPGGCPRTRLAYMRHFCTSFSIRLRALIANASVTERMREAMGLPNGPTYADLMSRIISARSTLFAASDGFDACLPSIQALAQALVNARDAESSSTPEAQWGFTMKHRVEGSLDESLRAITDALQSAGVVFRNLAVAATGGPGVPGQMIRRLLKVMAPVSIVVLMCRVLSVPLNIAIRAIQASVKGIDAAVKAVFCGSDEAEAQWGEWGETEGLAKAGLAALVAGLIGKSVPWTYWVTLVSRVPTFVSGAKNMVDWMIDFVQWSINSMLRLFNKGEIQFFRRRQKQVDDWYARVCAEARVGDGAAPGQPERVCDLYAEGRQLNREFPEGPSGEAIRRGLRELDAIYGSAASALAQIKGARPEPCTVVFKGDAGIGKSVAIKRLHAGLMAMCFPQELEAHGNDATRMMYSKDPGKFWDGYNANVHRTLLVDDLGMKKNSGGGSNGDMEDDYSMIMRVVNTAACPLNMAHLDAKGATYFRSPFVLMTSNLTDQQFTDQANLVLMYPDAFMRRLQILVDVKRAAGPGFATPEELASNDAWVFTVTEKVNGAASTSVFTNMLDVTRHIASRSLTRQQIFQGAVDADRAFIDQCRADQVQAQSWVALSAVSAVGAWAIPAMCRFVHGTQAFKEAYWGGDKLGILEKDFAVVSDFSLKHPYICAALSALSTAACVLIWRQMFLTVSGVISGLLSPFLNMFRRTDRQMIEIKPQSGIPTGGPSVKPSSDEELLSAERDLYLGAMYTVTVRAPSNPTSKPSGSILFVRGRAAIFPQHYLANWAAVGASHPEADLVFTNARGESFIESASRFRTESMGKVAQKCDNGFNDDLVMAIFNNTREHKNIMGRFATRAQHGTTLSDAAFVRFTGTAVEWAKIKCKWSQLLEYKDVALGGAYLVSQPLTYNDLPTYSGDCGAVIHSVDAKDGRSIYGMHVAGVHTPKVAGFAVFVSREWLEYAYGELSVPFVERGNAVSKLIGNTIELVEPQGDTAPDNRIVARSTLRSTSNSLFSKPGASMVSTAVTGWAIGDSTIQAQPLQPSDCSHQATVRALVTYCEPEKLADGAQHYRALAREACASALTRHGLPAHLNDRLLTIPEAIAGRNERGRFAEPINRATSPGYPWRPKGITKDKLFDMQGNLNMSSEAYAILEAEVNALLERVRSGADSGAIFSAAPKAESRKPGKLPRLIQGAPLHYVIVWRMLFWPIMTFYGQWAPEKELGLGLNPLGDHWGQLWSYMEDFSPKLGAGDYKQFDQSQEPCISLGILDALMDRYAYGPDSVARRVLWKEACGPHVILASFIYKLPKGMPSGHPATGLINGLYNCTLFTMCYARTLIEAKVADVPLREWRKACDGFADKVRLAVVGDDNLFSTRTAAINEQTLPGLMAEWGARYTMDQKDGVAISPTRDISEVTFIGRSFERRFGRRLAPLRMESIIDMGNWSQKQSLLTTAWYTSVYEQTAACLAMHDTAIWEGYLPKLNFAYSKLELDCQLARLEDQKEWADKAQALYESHYTSI
nr:TPA_asm: non-structural polyprotein [Nasturtium officinale dicistro-like virus 1]